MKTFLSGFWTPGQTVVDPSIPYMPLENPAGGGGVAHAIVGAILLAVIPSASLMDVTRHEALVGAVTVTVTPAASLLDVTRHRALAGGLTVTVTPSATLDVTRHEGIGGSITVTITPAATLDVTRHPSIVGATTVAVVPAAATDFTRHAEFVGEVAVSVVPAATMEYSVAGPEIVGAITISATPAATMLYTPAPIAAEIIGEVTVAVTPAATMQWSQPLTFVAGGVGYATRPAVARAIVADVTVEISVHSTLTYRVATVAPAEEPAAPAVAVVSLPVPEITAKYQPDPATKATSATSPPRAVDPVVARHSSIAGAVTMSIVPDAEMRFTPAPWEDPKPWTPEQDTDDDELLVLAVGYNLLMRR